MKHEYLILNSKKSTYYSIFRIFFEPTNSRHKARIYFDFGNFRASFGFQFENIN